MSVEDLVLSYVSEKLTGWYTRKKDMDSIATSAWTYNFHSYEEAKKFLDDLESKYSNDRDALRTIKKARLDADLTWKGSKF